MGEARSRGDAAKGGQGEAERVAEDSEKILEVGGALRLRVEARTSKQRITSDAGFAPQSTGLRC